MALDLPSDEARAIYCEFWELQRPHELTQIYQKGEYNFNMLLRLHEILKNLRMGNQQIIEVG